jgi:hypothetical protein
MRGEKGIRLSELEPLSQRTGRGVGARASQTAGVSTRRHSNVLIGTHPSSPVNFLRFLVPQKFRKFRKFAAHAPALTPSHGAFDAS